MEFCCLLLALPPKFDELLQGLDLRSWKCVFATIYARKRFRGVLWRLTPDKSFVERLRRADDGFALDMIVR